MMWQKSVLSRRKIHGNCYWALCHPICIHVSSETSATLEYVRQRPDSLEGSDRVVQTIFVGVPLSGGPLGEEMETIDQSKQFAFFVTPAMPMEHNTTITLHGFGTWSNYAAKITNPQACPYIHRSHGKLVLEALNYLWTVPLDIITMPVALPAFYIF